MLDTIKADIIKEIERVEEEWGRRIKEGQERVRVMEKGLEELKVMIRAEREKGKSSSSDSRSMGGQSGIGLVTVLEVHTGTVI